MNVVWVVVDCLRYDALSTNGYPRPTTEPIDERLESDFVGFTDVCTQSGFTLTVLSSLITGTYPSTHGVLRQTDEFPDDSPVYRDFVEGSDLGPVEAVPGMNFVTEEWNLKQAFDAVHNLEDVKAARDSEQARAGEIRERAESIIDEGTPFNMLLWLFDLHAPWLSEPRYDGANEKRDRYDTELRYVAEELEALFETLEANGVYDETLVVLTGDHGDLFDEYRRLPWSKTADALEVVPGVGGCLKGDGYLGHASRPMFEEILHVPLYVKLPDGRHGGKSVDGQAELVDILPTTLETAGVAFPEEVKGRSLLAQIERGAHGKQFCRAQLGPKQVDGLQRAIRGPEYKYIKFERPTLDDVQNIREDAATYVGRRFFTPERVLLARDTEAANVVDAEPDLAQAMRDRLDDGGESKRTEIPELSAEKRSELENLGYL